MTPETRAQAEDAVRVLDAVIARDRAMEAVDDWPRRNDSYPTAEYRQLRVKARETYEHAQHQIELYRARYGSAR